MNYKCIVSYDGSQYNGWASQTHHHTIQDIINKTLSNFYKQSILIIGASRTDTGVHANYQVFNFKENKAKLKPNYLKDALNNILPLNIRIKSIEVVNDHFHAQRDVKDKTYCYKFKFINSNKLPSVFNANYYWSINKELIDFDLLSKALNLFIGEHNFLSFSTSELSNTIRIINWYKVKATSKSMSIYINGNGFLRSMVRMIIATVYNVSIKKISLAKINSLLNNPKKGSAVNVALAAGLYLEKINY